MKVNASIAAVLQEYQSGEIPLGEAVSRIEGLRIETVGEMARLDIGRSSRCGIPEVILGEGKSPDQLAEIMYRHMQANGRSIATRVTPAQVEAVNRFIRDTEGVTLEHRASAEILILSRIAPPEQSGGTVAIITAGTSDQRVAEEARVVAEEMGCTVRTAYDVGVAGIHRLFPALRDLLDAHVFVVAAGREGTLPAIVAGLVDRPVIGVPVSTGYGYMGKGEAALASMLQSCAVVAVVNIDAGFMAGAFAARIANMVAEHE